MSRQRRRIGRVEAGLERDLAERREIRPAERSALRAQARAVDTAEQRADADLVSRANAVYLTLRAAAGLTGTDERAGDPFDQLLAELSRVEPGAGARDAPQP